MGWFNTGKIAQILAQYQNQQAPSAEPDPLSNPMETGIARLATPAEIQAGGYVPPQAGPSGDNLPSSTYQDTLNSQPMPQFDPGYGMHAATQMPSTVGNAMSGGLRSAAGMMGGMFGGNPSGSGPLKSIWQASPQGMTVPNQPYRPFTGQPQQPQQNSRFGMPQQSTAGTGSGYRRMSSPDGREQRDVAENQVQHFLSRGGRFI